MDDRQLQGVTEITEMDVGPKVLTRPNQTHMLNDST